MGGGGVGGGGGGEGGGSTTAYVKTVVLSMWLQMKLHKAKVHCGYCRHPVLKSSPLV